MMRPTGGWGHFLLTEWLLVASAGALAATSAYLRRLPSFPATEMQVLFLLWALFVVAKGLERGGLMIGLARSLEGGGRLPLKLVAATFFLSMVVTNDIALIVIVPVTLSSKIGRKDILVILEAFAANAGSALTPFGNPQNLFIYWFYHLDAAKFMAAIAPLSLASLAILLFASVFLRGENIARSQTGFPPVKSQVYVHTGLLVVVALTVLRLLPVACGGLVFVYVILFDRKALRVDYGLLLTFLCFFGLSENIRELFSLSLEHSTHIFLLSALVSQILSNVSATLLLAKFTTQWSALLWGANVGGFGTLISSFANLIAYKLYIDHVGRGKIASFSLKFMGLGYAMFLAGVGLYLALDSGLPPA